MVAAAAVVAGNLFVRPTSSGRRLLAGWADDCNPYDQASGREFARCESLRGTVCCEGIVH